MAELAWCCLELGSTQMSTSIYPDVSSCLQRTLHKEPQSLRKASVLPVPEVRVCGGLGSPYQVDGESLLWGQGWSQGLGCAEDLLWSE